MSSNPVRRIRNQRGLTLAQASKEAGVHLQAFFLQEQGVYPTLLPAILDWFEKQDYDLFVMMFDSEYRAYQASKRRASGEVSALRLFEWGPPSELHPFIQFRNELRLSRMGFAKAFCVHPGLLYRVEHGISQELPDQLASALREAGMPDHCIRELDFRIEEMCKAS